ncbi:MAG: DUF2975 domain-containing protein [Clostridiales bacterium]|nr:DUF2975 domain-containing protein [Clostridiales bacterium]
MSNASSSVLKARCDHMSVWLKVVFWGYLLYVAAMLGMWIWMLMQPEASFTINLLKVGDGQIGYGYFNEALKVNFARNSLMTNAMNSPKLIYMTCLICGIVQKSIVVAILWNVQNILRKIDKEDSPFMSINCKAISRIGALVMVHGLVRTALATTVLIIMGYSNGEILSGTDWLWGIIAGSIVICLSYIFEYGTALQTESDETL